MLRRSGERAYVFVTVNNTSPLGRVVSEEVWISGTRRRIRWKIIPRFYWSCKGSGNIREAIQLRRNSEIVSNTLNGKLNIKPLRNGWKVSYTACLYSEQEYMAALFMSEACDG